MACFPKIDRPCPLSRAERADIGDHCAHCDHRVHRLDDLSPAERRSLAAAAGGPICVSYRVPAGVAALALALAMPAGAQSLPPPKDPATVVTATASQGPMSPVAGQADAEPECEEELDRIELVGGISAPHEAQWLDEESSSLPEIPVAREDDAG